MGDRNLLIIRNRDRNAARNSESLTMSLVIPILLLGLLASFSPSTMIVFILLLATARARVNAAAFLIGWCVSLVLVFAVGYAIGWVPIHSAWRRPNLSRSRRASPRRGVDCDGCPSVAAPDRDPGEAEAYLTALRDRVTRAGPAIFAIVSLLVGAYLTIDGIAGVIGTWEALSRRLIPIRKRWSDQLSVP